MPKTKTTKPTCLMCNEIFRYDDFGIPRCKCDREKSKTTNFTAEQMSEIEAMITERIVTFYDALIYREQIYAPHPKYLQVFGEPVKRPKLEVVK